MQRYSHAAGNLTRRVLKFLIGDETWTFYHFIVFSLTFFSYVLVHASRKTLSTVKPSLIAEWTDNSTSVPLFDSAHAAESFLAFLDGAFLAAYAVGLYAGGTLGDRYNPSKILAMGMWASAIAVFLFGTLSKWMMLQSRLYYALTWTACGLFQSVVWPTEICVMGNWFGCNSRGAVFGLWSACASVGNILGTLISSRTVQIGYEYSFAANSCLLFVGAFFIFICLNPHPAHRADTLFPISSQVDTLECQQAITFFRAWLLPGVVAYSLAYACLKLVNYSFFFWLPLYLHAHFGWEEHVADKLSTWYDIGGIFAAIIAGAASDRFSSRTPILVGMLILSMGSLFFYANSPNDVLINCFLMTITGFFVGGPANLISSAVSADLAKSDAIRSAKALSTVSGIIDGTGSVGAGIGQLLIPRIEQAYGWIAIFYGFIIMMLCTVLCLLPLLWQEIRGRRREHYVTLLESSGCGESDSERECEPLSSEISEITFRIRHHNNSE